LPGQNIATSNTKIVIFTRTIDMELVAIQIVAVGTMFITYLIQEFFL
jgi:hypothetical protein